MKNVAKELKKNLVVEKIILTFAAANGKLGYGVMVTLQILVLSFQVRILVSQQGSHLFLVRVFF